MFDLEKAIDIWRARLDRQAGIYESDLTEVEEHLREETKALVNSGLSPREAFLKAVADLGNEVELGKSFREVNWKESLFAWLRTQPALLGSYFKVGLRSLFKHKTYSGISIFGLIVGLASFAIIMLYVHDELSYDQYHADADRIYRIVFDRIEQDGSISPRVATPGGLKPAMLEEIPEIEHATRLHPTYWGKQLLKNGVYTYYDDNFLYVDDSFFDIFSFRFIHGNPQSALADRASIVLTESFAMRFFGSNQALGQTLSFNQDRPLKVTGIIEDVAPQSHFNFDFVISTALGSPQWNNNWGQGHMHTYIKVKPRASMEKVDSKIKRIVNAHKAREAGGTYFTQPLTGINGIHLSPPRFHELQPHGDLQYIGVLSMVACFVLLIAGMNYVNLATARSAIRMKEIGMRKVVGARRKNLIYQFLTESILVSFIACVIAISLAEVVLPFFNDLMQKDLSLLSANSQPIWFLTTVLILGFGTAAGLYPAVYLSSFKPIAALKKQRAPNRKGYNLRRILVISQFALSGLLLVGLTVVRQQIDYMQSAKLGFDKDQVLVIRDFRRVPNRDRDLVVRHELEALAGVVKVGAFNEMVGLGDLSSETPMNVMGSDNQQGVLWTNVGYHFLDAVGIELKDGRNFLPAFETASSHDVVILNETAVQRLGVPEPVLGQQIVVPNSPPRTIIGIVKDFHFTSLHNEIKPFAFGWTPSANNVAIKMSGGEIAKTLTEIEAIWSRFVPGVPIDFYFLDEAIDRLYRSEKNFGAVFSRMTALILVIACLGLFGLAAFTAEQRTKEIGIRKVVGATIRNIVGMLSTEFVKVVLIANLIAWPIAYYFMDKWLTNFAYRVQIGPEHFLLPGLVALGIAFLTVCSQTVRAARANPIDALRSE